MGGGQANNVVVKTYGEPREGAPHNHVDLVQLLDIVDLEAGSAVAGSTPSPSPSSVG